MNPATVFSHIPQPQHFSFKRVQFFGLRAVEFPVYAPNFITKWPLYRARLWTAPFIFMLWFWKGLRYKAGFPALGRRVELSDMLRAHPGKPKQCLCRGEGVITTYRIGPNKEQQKGVQFCQSMEDQFKRICAPAVFDTKSGPRWLKGCAPEDMVQKR